MPPRIKVPSSGWTINLPLRLPLPEASQCTRSFTNRAGKPAWYADSYIQQQKRQHENAKKSNTSGKRKKLADRKKTYEPGEDPVRGNTTVFVQSFDNPPPKHKEIVTLDAARGGAVVKPMTPETPDEELLNFRLSRDKIQAQLSRSKLLSNPLGLDGRPSFSIDMEDQREANERKDKAALEAHEASHAQALVAIDRIMKLETGNNKDKRFVNIDRCIQTFGRHNTDNVLPSKNGTPQEEKWRAGPDVGSSEVQIAVLTAKIRNLANALDFNGKHDYHNKRKLRLLVHKRQKLLKYLHRKERAGPRFQHVISTLGLTDATWRGEIHV